MGRACGLGPWRNGFLLLLVDLACYDFLILRKLTEVSTNVLLYAVLVQSGDFKTKYILRF